MERLSLYECLWRRCGCCNQNGAYILGVLIFCGCLYYYCQDKISNLTFCLIHFITLHLVLLPWQPVDCWLVYSVCSVPSYSSVTVSGYLQGKRGGKAPNHVIDSPPSPQPMLALEILGWMMVCVCVLRAGRSLVPRPHILHAPSGLVEK